MKKAMKIELTVEPKNLEKVKSLIEKNQELFIRVLMTKMDIKIV